MTETNLETLARRGVACKHWRWMPGMLVIHPATHSGATAYTFRLTVEGYTDRISEYPDLTDPATLGCLLALVREAHHDPQMSVETYSFLRNKWRCVGVWFSGEWVATTEAAALVAALEAAS